MKHILRSARKKLGLTQHQFAELLGVKQPAYAHWELGTRFPSRKALEKIYRFLQKRDIHISLKDIYPPEEHDDT
jgi:transcriptional regulator with XRE-family HTH domain